MKGKGESLAGFEENWKKYRRVRNTFFAVFLSGIPVFMLVSFVSQKLLHTITPASVTAGLWMALFGVNGIRLQLWRCPRCGECFSGTWWYNKSFLARRCVHCGLEKYETAS